VRSPWRITVLDFRKKYREHRVFVGADSSAINLATRGNQSRINPLQWFVLLTTARSCGPSTALRALRTNGFPSEVMPFALSSEERAVKGYVRSPWRITVLDFRKKYREHRVFVGADSSAINLATRGNQSWIHPPLQFVLRATACSGGPSTALRALRTSGFPSEVTPFALSGEVRAVEGAVLPGL